MHSLPLDWKEMSGQPCALVYISPAKVPIRKETGCALNWCVFKI
jgi:hypothetical protein